MGQFNEPSHDFVYYYVIIVTWLDIPAELNADFIVFIVV